MEDGGGSRLTILGLVATFLLSGALCAVGGVVMLWPADVDSPGSSAVAADPSAAVGAPTGGDLDLIEPEDGVPRLDAASPYVMKDGVIEIEISEYAGYAGLIAANGGLAPNADSWFAKNAGFQLKLVVSESDAWSPVNAGRIAGSVTTVDVLPLYGRQFDAVVPVQLGFSRGADAIVVRDDIKRMSDLKGKIVVASQFSEAEFFLRYLAQEAGMKVSVVSEPIVSDKEAISLAFAEDAFVAGDVFLSDLSGDNLLAGCVTWEPKTSEVLERAKGKARVLASNRNLLVIADVVVLNRGFAEQNPKVVEGLVEGVIFGNDLVNRDPAQLAVVGKAFGWSEAQTKAELSKVHLSNLPENLAFFNGEIDMAGSFGGIFQSSVLAYGREIIKDVASPDRFVFDAALKSLQQQKKFANQTISIAPIRSGNSGSIEDNPLLSKDIRFLFEPNSSNLDMKDGSNLDNLGAIKRLLQVSPGSTVLLRGHVDDARKEEFRKQGGDSMVRSMALKAIALSTERAVEVEKQLVAVEKVDDKRVETVGIGWEEPVKGANADANRRVEVQWFTLE